MSRRPLEPLVLLALSLLLTATLGLRLILHWHQTARVVPAPLDGLGSRRELPAYSPEAWIEYAQTAPLDFRRAASFCQANRMAPLPNCATLFSALHALAALPDNGS